MYISVDRTGQVREAYPLNSDNAGLEDAARDQLLKWRLKPAVMKGVPVQVESALSFHFGTTSLADAPGLKPSPGSSLAAGQAGHSMKVSPGVSQGMLIYSPPPAYPDAERAARIEGTVVLEATIDKNGMPQNIRVVTAPADSLAKAAVAAVRQWRYKPYLLNGDPVEIDTTINLVFRLNAR